MAEFVLKYADPRGEVRQQVAEAASEAELRDRMAQQGYLVYSVKPKGGLAALSGAAGRAKLDREKFLIFNQQFVTLIRAGLPILKSLDLLADRLTDAKLGAHIKAVRDDVRNGTVLSEAFARRGIFPPIYTTSVLAGEKSGALAEVLDRFIHYQRLALAVRKKILLSLVYPSLLVGMTLLLVVFLITYVVPNFAQLYSSMNARLPWMTQVLIAFGRSAQTQLPVLVGLIVALVVGFRVWSRGAAAQARLDRAKIRAPLFGEIWIKYQVAQFARILGTLLTGGIPLVQAIETASDSIGSVLLKNSLDQVRRTVREGRSLSASLQATGVFPPLSIDMIEVGESTGALAAMLDSVAEFYDDDVSTRMSAVLALIEPSIMIFMGIFVAFVLVSLYLPIFSLADMAGS